MCQKSQTKTCFLNICLFSNVSVEQRWSGRKTERQDKKNTLPLLWLENLIFSSNPIQNHPKLWFCNVFQKSQKKIFPSYLSVFQCFHCKNCVLGSSQKKRPSTWWVWFSCGTGNDKCRTRWKYKFWKFWIRILPEKIERNKSLSCSAYLNSWFAVLQTSWLHYEYLEIGSQVYMSNTWAESNGLYQLWLYGASSSSPKSLVHGCSLIGGA